MAKNAKPIGTEPRSTGVSGAPASSTGERPYDSPARRQAVFLKGIAGTCGCPRCCNMRDLADVVLRGPGSEY